MSLPASYHSGFAPRDGQPLYPSLWRGCIGAWAPCLGPSGLTLRDWSVYGRNASLSGFTAVSDWVLSSGRYSLSFDGTDNVIETGYSVSGLSQVSLSFWGWRATTSSRMIVVDRNGAGTSGFGFDAFTDGNMYILAANGSNSYGSVSGSGTVGWHNYSIVFNGNGSGNSERLRFWRDGVQQTLTYTGTIPATIGTTSNTFRPGAWDVGRSIGNKDDLRLYDRVLNANDIVMLSSRRGIAYELAPRRRSSPAAAAFNRRRRLLVGASH